MTPEKKTEEKETYAFFSNLITINNRRLRNCQICLLLQSTPGELQELEGKGVGSKEEEKNLRFSSFPPCLIVAFF